MNQIPEIDDGGLMHSLLDEPLISYRRVSDGHRMRASLPELFIVMARDDVRDFPALRAHQRHPWHAFLCQVAAIALHAAGRSKPFETAETWKQALLALTPQDPDGAAWCLVAPSQRPAFLQAPVLDRREDDWTLEMLTPDRLDMLITSKNHDLKRTRMMQGSIEDWCFALLSLQTQEGSNSGSYKGISRMNSGAGSRPGVGIAVGKHPGTRWVSDVEVLLANRGKVAETHGLQVEGGIALTWLIPWDGSAAIPFTRLDPYYIEICRRVRLRKAF